jgi:hypothetical protein
MVIMSMAHAREDKKAIAIQWLQMVSAGDVEGICQITAPTWRMHGGLPGLPPGPEGIRILFASFGRIEQQWKIEDIIAEKEKVVVRATNYCQQESFLGIPSNGKPQVFTATFIFHIVDGMIWETWRNADDLGRVLQLGATIVPATSV